VKTAVVMLAGGIRSGTFRSQIGFPIAGLPLEAECTLLQGWLRLIAATRSLEGADLLVVCSNERDRAWFAAESRRLPADSMAPKVVVDPRPHRGVAGTLADLREEFGEADSMLVIESSSLPPTSLDRFFEPGPTGQSEASARIGVGAENRWLGVYRLETHLLQEVTPLGYVDLKEQFLTKMLLKGHRIEAVECGDTAVQIADRRNYLRAVRIWRSRRGLTAERSDRVSGFSVVCPGVELMPGSHVADSCVLPGAVLGEGAVVARSVIGPMIRVPRGAVIVDGVLADPGVVVQANREDSQVERAADPRWPEQASTDLARSWGVQS